jgi:ABC-type branched-subunit amino acid transport system substrate-binding protein
VVWSLSVCYYEAPKQYPVAPEMYKRFVAATGSTTIDFYVGLGHMAVWLLAEAAKAAGSSETVSVLRALKSKTFETAAGPYHFRPEDNQGIYNIAVVGMGADEAAKDGWSVRDYDTVSIADAIEPPSPGKAFTF